MASEAPYANTENMYFSISPVVPKVVPRRTDLGCAEALRKGSAAWKEGEWS